MRVEPFGLSTFEALIGETFGVQTPSGATLTLQLTTVTPSGPTGQGRPGFSLLFAGSDAEPLEQGTYPFSHDSMGTHPIFIVPVARDAGGFVYEAVFG